MRPERLTTLKRNTNKKNLKKEKKKEQSSYFTINTHVKRAGTNYNPDCIISGEKLPVNFRIKKKWSRAPR